MSGRALALLLLAAAAGAVVAAETQPEGATPAAGGGGVRAAAPTPRWFLGGRTVTRVLLEKDVVTERTPTSCVVVAPSLPPCRSMRAMQEQPDIQPARPAQVLATEPAQLPASARETGGEPEARTLGRSWTRSGGSPLVVSSEPALVATPVLPSQQVRPAQEDSGWNWNLFGSDITVTTVMRQVETVKKSDPNLMVTFSVTGCQPSRLPFNLDYCDKVPRVEVVKETSPTA